MDTLQAINLQYETRRIGFSILRRRLVITTEEDEGDEEDNDGASPGVPAYSRIYEDGITRS